MGGVGGARGVWTSAPGLVSAPFLGVVFGLVLGVGFFALETLYGPNLGPFWGSCWSLFGTFLGAALASSFKVDLKCDFD